MHARYCKPLSRNLCRICHTYSTRPWLGSSASLAVAGAAAALLLHKGADAGTEVEYSGFLRSPENLDFLLG
jgi:hypothetical protein